MPVRNALNYLLAGAFVVCTAYAPMAAQSNSSLSNGTAAPAKPVEHASGYNQPPKNILDVMHAPSPPVPMVSPTHDTILLVSWQDYPSIARVATPFLRLAGVRVEPKNHSKHDTPGGYGITPCATELRTGASRRWRANSCRASRGRVPGRARLGRGRKAIRLCQSLLPIRSSSGSAMPRPAKCNKCPESVSTPCSTTRCNGCRTRKRFWSSLCPRGWARRRPNQSCRLVRASRRPTGKKDRAAPTKTATPSATSTTRIFSITSRPRNSLSSMRPP